MKQIRILSCVLLIAVLLLCCTGCKEYTLKSVDELLRAPKLTGENAEIQQVFENAVQANVSLVSPLTGEYRSAFIFYDFDADKTQEAVVFYSLPDFPNEVHMHLLDKTEQGWNSLCDITGNGSEVYSISFVNLDKDSEAEFAVTWTVSDTKRAKTLSLYKLCREQEAFHMQQITAIQIMDYMVLDIDLDGVNEVFYTVSKIEKERQLYTAAVFRVQSEELIPVPLSEVSLSQNIENLLKYNYDKKAGACAVYIDCLASDGRYFTEIIQYDYPSGSLVRPFDEAGISLAYKTYRTQLEYCEDYNNDYQIEIPAQTDEAEAYYLDDNEQIGGKLSLLTYYQLLDHHLEPVDRFFLNEYDRYRFRINDYYENSRIEYSISDRTLSVKCKSNDQQGEMLFSIKNNNINIAEQSVDEESFYNGLSITVTQLGEQLEITKEKIISFVQFTERSS